MGKLLKIWSGRRESNSRPTAWKALGIAYLVVIVMPLGATWALFSPHRPPAEQHFEQRSAVHYTPDYVRLLVAREAALQGIPPDLALQRAYRESRFRVDAIGHEPNGTVSYGTMQLNSRWYPNAPLLSPEENIRAGVRLLAKRYQQCGGDHGCAHWAYRSGLVKRQPPPVLRAVSQ